MTQEQKDLLLKDLCARLPYGVKGLVTFNGNHFMTQHQVEDRTIDGKLYDRFAEFQDSWYDNVTIKPYLFPLSSMTDGHKRELSTICKCLIHFTDWEISFPNYEDNNMSNWQKIVSWVYKNHFDWRGLIHMGLAIDATGLNIYKL